MQATLFPIIDENTKKLPLYLTSIGYDYKEGHMDRPDGYDAFQWLMTIEGTGKIKLGNQTHRLTKGTGMFLYPEAPHTYYPIEDEWVTEWLSFSGNDAAAIVASFGYLNSSIYEIENSQTLSQSLRKIYTIASSMGQHRSLETTNSLFNFLVETVKATAPEATTSSGDRFHRLAPVIRHMEENYAHPLDLNQLAHIIGVTPQYLCSLFKKVTGTRPALYQNQIRISHAKELMLIHPDRSIAEIAGEVGFESPSYFSAVFKRHENLTPNGFISLHRSQR